MGRRNVLIIGNAYTPSYQIGIRQPFLLLEKEKDYRFETKWDWEVTKETISKFDVVILFRTVKQRSLDCLMWAKELGKKTVYFIDDHFLAIPMKASLGKRYADPEIRRLYTEFLRKADVVKVDSSFFSQHIRTHFNRNAVYFPASVDFSYVDKLEARQRTDNTIVIGYEGGSKDSAFSPVVPAILRILEKYRGRVRVEFMGYIPSALKSHHRVTYIEGDPNYRSFLKRFKQASWDIGLAPLEHTLFDDCKTNNKFREYAACSVPGIYSATPAYRDGVIHRETGMYAASNPDSWASCMEQLIEDAELRRKIRLNAGEYARKHYSIARCAEQWHKLVLGV
ncbi:glycosyltransferase family protein [Paenibacillus gansuensis]|uniref:Glycosyltransferase n=1 Tax=Paenibacillus gansuensis TaxID=306542 RepID=A0ABW5PAN4_9BACL